MEELKQALDVIAGSGAALKAVIVDDEFENIGVPSFVEWTELKDQLQEWPELHDPLMDRLETLSHNPAEPPSVELLNAAIYQLSLVPTADQKAALDGYTHSEHLLQRLRQFLEDLGFVVSCHSAKPQFSADNLPFLCLIDYQIDPEPMGGQTATSIFESLMQFAEKEQKPPPFVILMSKALTDADVDTWIRLAEAAGFFRFNYGFLNKEQFVTNHAYLAFPLLQFVKYERLSKAYFLQMSSLVAEAHEIARRVSRQLFQVTPPEANLFKDIVSREGSSLSTELSNLFAELFSREIKRSPRVVDRMVSLEKAITDQGVPVPYRQQRSALHRLYADLLHEKVESKDGEPSFGDIYEDDRGGLFLILSQECDLATGEGRERKSNRVIAIQGEFRNVPPSKSDGEMFAARPIFASAGDRLKWIWWNLGSPVIFPIQQFQSNTTFREYVANRAYLIGETRTREGRQGDDRQDWLEAERQICMERHEEGFAMPSSRLKKRWKLRFADAEDIQHTFATRITRVALSVMPEFIQVHTFRCSRDGEIIDDSPPIYIYQVQKKFALAPESQGTCHAIDNGGFMSDSLIKTLSLFVTYEEFQKALDQEQLLALSEDGHLLLTKTTKQYRKGKKSWKGSA